MNQLLDTLMRATGVTMPQSPMATQTNVEPMSFYGALGQPVLDAPGADQQAFLSGQPQPISGGRTTNLAKQVQQMLEGKQAGDPGAVQGILSGRFDQEQQGPSFGNYLQSAINSLNGSYSSPQDLATGDMTNNLKNINSVAGIEKDLAYADFYGKGGSGGGATMQMYRTLKGLYPEADDMTLIRLAQNKISSDLTIDPMTGKMSPINGAPAAAGAMKYGEQSGIQQANLGFAAPIAQAVAVGKAEGEIAGGILQKENMANNSNSLTAQARAILPYATGSTVGAGVARGKRLFGVSDDSTKANARLQIIGTQLVSQVPRFEGPQSNYDVDLYKAAAGRIGDPSVPVGDRLAALDQIEALNAKYATQGNQANLPLPTAATINGPNANQVRGPVQISGDDDYNRLPSGSQFMGPDGKTRTKP